MSRENALKVAAIVRDAGGCIVGRTRLQKIAYLLCSTGLEEGLSFAYKHYGPYSEELAIAAREASLLGLVSENEQTAAWGGTYSTYKVSEKSGANVDPARSKLTSMAAKANAVELELAATAVFLAKDYSDPWAETARRKPEKVGDGRLERAKELYCQLANIKAPVPLPPIN